LQGVKVLDSWALIAYFLGEESSPKVIQILKDAARTETRLLISVINWGEVLYTIEMRYGKEKKAQAEDIMNEMLLDVVDVNRELARLASHLKASEKLPYGDAFAAALAMSRRAELITGDKDFRVVEGRIRINWI
jgi:ribonuclease VapC